MRWNFLYVSLMDVLENAMLKVLLSFNIFMNVMESLVFLLFSSEPICKGYSELGFRLKVSLSCRPSLLIFSICLQVSNWCTAATTEEQHTRNDFITFKKVWKERSTFSITFLRRFASRMHKEFHCSILQNVDNKDSKTIPAVKQSPECDIFGLEGFNKQTKPYRQKK